MEKLSILSFILTVSVFNAQVISGTIISKNENQPVPYVKIGIEKRTTGTISDNKGNFSIDLTGLDPDQKVKIEVPGYELYEEAVREFKKHDQQKVVLNEKTKTIKEIAIKPKKLVDKNWGVTTKTKSILYFVNPVGDKAGFLGETALEFNAKKRSKIKNINLNIARYVSTEPVLMRYSIYSEKDGYPDKNILDEEITVQLTEDMIKDGTFTLDVNDHNIWVKGKFFVGINFLKAFNGNIKISAALFKTGFIREFYGDWKKMTIAAPAINIDVKMDKSGKDTKDDDGGYADDDVSQAWLADNSKNIAEADKSIYGKNDSAGKYLKLKDTDLYYEVYGTGEPLVLLHGNSGSIKDYYQQIPVLSKQYKIIAVDTRGQGKSKDTSKKDFTYKLFADDVKALADELKLDKVNIVGWSDGGNTGLEFALKYPERLNKLVTIGANAFPEGVEDKLIERFTSQIKQLNDMASGETFNERRLLKIMLTEPGISKDDLNKIKSKVLVIAGDRDVIKPDHTEFISKQIPNAEKKIYKDTTHMVPYEQPDQLNADILSFLSKK
ncbi:alpha/beta fold hydrolase [Chryseobacterium bernardetii]|uniref:Alpha/beta fold hydrolase n=1 Tax=Chryseobacterium bernardetii TaxID=1241978 RepID=A0A3G6T5Y5_9FLAO|nr:alpha/beta fold hydrolase [Chryseobacterium bernardetii]AZB23319.1 alpha/beta fold hydrolase [Chryseobacterium bernardetii]